MGTSSTPALAGGALNTLAAYPAAPPCLPSVPTPFSRVLGALLLGSPFPFPATIPRLPSVLLVTLGYSVPCFPKQCWEP